jgi:hypothetical protein
MEMTDFENKRNTKIIQHIKITDSSQILSAINMLTHLLLNFFMHFNYLPFLEEIDKRFIGDRRGCPIFLE